MKNRECVSGPRWAGVKQYILTVPMMFNLEVKIIDEDKGFIRTTITFEVEGEAKDIKKFYTQMKSDFKRYNE